MPFKAGDVVVLRSGGAAMTVEEAVRPGVYRCVWHDERGCPHTAEFDEAVLHDDQSQTVHLLEDVKMNS